MLEPRLDSEPASANSSLYGLGQVTQTSLIFTCSMGKIHNFPGLLQRFEIIHIKHLAQCLLFLLLLFLSTQGTAETLTLANRYGVAFRATVSAWKVTVASVSVPTMPCTMLYMEGEQKGHYGL